MPERDQSGQNKRLRPKKMSAQKVRVNRTRSLGAHDHLFHKHQDGLVHVHDLLYHSARKLRKDTQMSLNNVHNSCRKASIFTMHT
jgi:hypothetical protein